MNIYGTEIKIEPALVADELMMICPPIRSEVAYGMPDTLRPLVDTRNCVLIRGTSTSNAGNATASKEVSKRRTNLE